MNIQQHLVYRFLFLCLLVGFSVGLAQAQEATLRKDAHPKAVKDYTEGVRASFERNNKTAVRLLESAIKREPNFRDALVELAGVYYNNGAYSEAEIYLERVAKFDGSAGAKGLYGLAMAEIKQEKYAEAIPHLEAYLNEDWVKEERRQAAERYQPKPQV